jgi:hydrogenase expression/formation protein HypC
VLAAGAYGVGFVRPMCLAIPGRVVEDPDPETGIALVDVGGVRRRANLGLLALEEGGVEPGDWVLIHVGFAISRIDEHEAEATLSLLAEMGDAYEQELEELSGSSIE